MKSKPMGIMTTVLLILALVIVAACAQGATPTPTTPTTPAPTTPAPTTPAPTSAIKPMKLIFSSAYTQNSALGLKATTIMNEVTKRTDGKITFDTFWGGALAAPAAQLDLVKTRGADIVDGSMGYNPSNFPGFGNFSWGFPFGPSDPRIVIAAMKAVTFEFPQVQAMIAKQNIYVLPAFSSLAGYSMLSKKPINSLADFQGKKVALFGTYFGAWMEPVGMTPVTTTTAERYSLLQQNLVDIDLLLVDLQQSLKLYELAKYALFVGWSMSNQTIFVNLGLWNSFSPELQKIFNEASVVGEAAMLSADDKLIEDAKAAFKANGVTFTSLSDADYTKWASLVPDIPAQMAQELIAGGMPGYEMVARYQAVGTQMGFKWPRVWGIKK